MSKRRLLPLVLAAALAFTVASPSAAMAAPLKSFSGSAAPTISGEHRVGLTLKAKAPASWSPKPTSVTYQWLRNGKPIKGATGAAYKEKWEDGTTVTNVKVTAHRAGYAARTWVSNSKVKTAKIGRFTGELWPAVAGARVVGETLTESVFSTISPEPKLTYQWVRDRVAIRGATKSTYVQVAADIGHAVELEVTASKLGYVTERWSMFAPNTASKPSEVQ
ncbi:hypothetical protein ASF30_09845 [Leifsonia sp. Leaf264]|nr:hypothetical protein ASF30_09845 [Leifsonia sp. Leaf264]